MAQPAGGEGRGALDRPGGAAGAGPSLVEWSPVYSNYFAYSGGKEGGGVDLYRVIRSAPGETEPLLGPRGSITDGRAAPAAQQLDHHHNQQQQGVRARLTWRGLVKLEQNKANGAGGGGLSSRKGGVASLQYCS